MRSRPLAQRRARRSTAAAFAAVIAVAVLTGSVALADALAPDDAAATGPPAPSDAACGLEKRIGERLAGRYPPGSWAPIPVEATDEDLAALGLPGAEVLAKRPYPVPTAFYPDGTTREVGLDVFTPGEAPRPPSVLLPAASTPVATFAGTGCVGIRPGAFVMFISGSFPLGDWAVSLCSLAHVYGSQGSYDISTAGHCAKGGQTATAIGVLGGGIPVLLDFGRVATSHDGGIGNDYAVIDVSAPFQPLVTPNMCFWGGPFFGTFTRTGSVVSFQYSRNGLVPTVGVTPDPGLAQAIVHYGHGLAIGTGGTPRAGVATTWTSTYFTFFGAILFGDSGSGANTATSQAAGVITHIYVDGVQPFKTGFGTMAGTRATRIGTPAQSLPVFVPVPVPGV